MGQDNYVVPDSIDYAGRAGLFRAPVTGDILIDDADVMFNGACDENTSWYNYCYLGRYASFADADDDGEADLLLGSAYGAALFLAPFEAEVSYEDAPVAVFDEFGYEIDDFSFVGDIDGDGLPDVAGSYRTDTGDLEVVVYFAPLSGVYRASDASAVASTEEHWVYLVYGPVADYNGDGYLDTTYLRDVSGTGTLSVSLGPLTGDVAVDTLTTTFEAPEVGYFGNSAAALDDLNGDGCAELVIGAPQFGGGGSSPEGPGAAFVFFGPLSSAMTNADADQVLSGDGDDAFGADVANIADVDGDGFVDLAVTGTGDDDGGTDAGAVWLYSGVDLLGG